MRIFLLFFLFFTIISTSKAQIQNRNITEQLNQAILKKQNFDKDKLKRIADLEERSEINGDLKSSYNVYSALFNEYKSFNYEKAFFYCQKIHKIAHSIKDPVRIAESKINFGFILLSSGMFKETFDSLRTVKSAILPDTLKKEYYFLQARAYYDLADYDKDNYYSSIYNKRANQYIDSAINLSSHNSYQYSYYRGLKYLKLGQLDLAEVCLKKLFTCCSLTNHELAITASTLSDLYIQKKFDSEAIKLLEIAAKADITASTKETSAMFNLASLYHKKGDIKNAYLYINEAMDDANFYGARQRKVQVSAVLMIIAGQKINSVEEQKQVLFIYSLLLTVLVIVVISFAYIIYKQLKRLRKAEKIIVKTNTSLQLTINKLEESDRIKEEYIGYYFNLITEYINKLDSFRNSINNKLVLKKFDDIGFLVNNINLKKEREELFLNFDKAFLILFPNFVDCFNSLFLPENQVKLNPGELLNTDLRIFALIRLGISDTEKIARILEYSINTIYNYKTRIKSKSILPNDDFEASILSIKTM